MSLRERKKLQSRQAILAAARELIDHRGYEQATMRDIAAAADISYQTLYNYFPTKALILQAILSARARNVAAVIADLLQAYEGGLLHTLHEINRVRMDIISEGDRAAWRIVAIDVMHQAHGAAQIYQRIDSTAHEVLQELLTQAQLSSELSEQVDVSLLSDTLFSLAQHSISGLMLRPDLTGENALAHLNAQVDLLVSPYLESTHGNRLGAPR